MKYKVSYIQQWHPTSGTHYSQQLRIQAKREELESKGVHLEAGLNYTDTISFPYIVIALGLNKDKRILWCRNSLIKYEPID